MAYTRQKLTDEQCKEAAEIWERHGRNYSHLAAELGIARSTAQNRIKKAAKRGFLALDPAMPGFQVERVSTSHDANGNILSSTIRQAPERQPYEAPKGHAVKGVSTLLDADGNVAAQWVKTRADQLDPINVAEAVKESFSKWEPPKVLAQEPAFTNADFLTLYPLADVHFGLKAIASEVGADYDLDKATERFRDLTTRLFERSPNSDTALVLQLGDWTHVNDDTSMTPANKNPLDVTDRLLDLVTRGVDLLIDHIHLALTKHRRVKVKVIKGNHDRDIWIALFVALQQRFRDEPRVEIDDGAADYWFFRFHNNLFGAHHGHRLKGEEMAGAMATECREDWGQTDHKYFFHGHLHHDWVRDILGVRVECMRTMADADQFHSAKYGTRKSIFSATYHRETGEDGRAKINLPSTNIRAST